MAAPHPEVPDDSERDHSLLITEAQQAELIETLTEIETDIREATLAAVTQTPGSIAAAEQWLAGFSELAGRARRAARNVVTIEERIAHLDFDVEDGGGEQRES